MEERLRKLDHVFNPRSIAFVGATQGAAKWGFIVYNNIIVGGYDGKLYPVNPGRQEVLGLKAYPTVRDIPGEVDLAVLTVPARAVPSAIDDCIARGVKAAVIISAGFKELGGAAAVAEAEIVSKAEAAGMVIVGPNGQGVCCPGGKLYSWMPLFYPPPGNLAFICQSGNILNMLIGHVLNAGFGVSKAVSSGNEALLKTEDYYSYLAEDPDTDVIVSYIEGVDDGRRFFELARQATRAKPIVALKGGRTESGVSAASSHTGAMAVSGRLFESACRLAGITLAKTINEAGTVAASFVNRPLPRGRRVGILTGGGGLGVIAADVCSEHGLEVVELSDATLREIGRYLPDWWVPGNPVDMVAGLDLSIIKPILEILMESGEVDAILLIFVEAPRIGASTEGEGANIAKIWDMVTQQVATHIHELYERSLELEMPLYVTANLERKSGIGGTLNAAPRTMMIYESVEDACDALGHMVRYSEYLKASGIRP